MNQSQLQALLDRQIKQGQVHNIVAAVQSKDGQVNLGAAAGMADAAGSVPMTVDQPYFIASITKMYTAAVILKLHEQGQVDLDETISKYLPAALIQGIHVYQGQDYSGQIKLYQLLNQTSGLADYFEGKTPDGQSLFDELKQSHDRALSLEDMLEMVRGMSPNFAPGTKAHYSDTNFQLLGAITEAVTGQSLAENFRAMIFDPLQLQQTYLFDNDPSRPAPAALYFKDQVMQIPQFMASSKADGGIVSTAAETQVFLRAFFDGRLFEPTLFARMTQRWHPIFFPIQYGYGLMRYKLPRIFTLLQASPEYLGHSGSTGSFAFIIPEKALYLTGTVNQTATPAKPFRLMPQIVNILR